MIVLESGTSLLLMTQPDHAALARQVMNYWRAGGFTDAPRRMSILRAIEDHDNGCTEHGARVPMTIDARRLPNRPFHNPADAAAVWRKASVITLSGFVSAD